MAPPYSSTAHFNAVNSVKNQETDVSSIPDLDKITHEDNQNFERDLDKNKKDQMRHTPHELENLSLKPNSTSHKKHLTTVSSNGENIALQKSTYPLNGTSEVTHVQRQTINTTNNNLYHNNFYLNSSSKDIDILITNPPNLNHAREKESRRKSCSIGSLKNYSPESQFGQQRCETPTDDQKLALKEPILWRSQQLQQNSCLTSSELISRTRQRTLQNLCARSQLSCVPHSSEDDRAPNSTSRPELKKRKRKFSNRTKAGCMTCRKRKKKCDETKPKCNNCLRGGFVCTGYQQSGSNLKQNQKPCPVSLQPKAGNEKPAYFLETSSIPTSAIENQQTEPLSGRRNQNLRLDLQRDYHLGVKPNHSIMSSSSDSHVSTPITATSISHYEKNYESTYDSLGSKFNVNRTKIQVTDDFENMSSATPSSISLTSQPPKYGAPAESNAQMAAQLVLSYLSSASHSCSSNKEYQVRRTSQKEEMLAGRPYSPSDNELVQDREICMSACWEFNNSINPNLGLSAERRAQIFQDIVYPRLVGKNTIVEVPFYCVYGYNISIGQDVVIGMNCTIQDNFEVQIGDRCFIGPNLRIYTVSHPSEQKRRLGGKEFQTGKKVIIESDCWIGGGVTIVAGQTIGKGANVGDGSVVTKDVPPYTIARGNPAHILRSISTSE